MTLDDKDSLNMIKNLRISEIEDLLADNDSFLSFMNYSPLKRKLDIIDFLRSIIKEFKNIIKVIMSVKKLIRSFTLLSVSVEFDSALDKIMNEICDNLCCDRVNIIPGDYRYMINRLQFFSLMK